MAKLCVPLNLGQTIGHRQFPRLSGINNDALVLIYSTYLLKIGWGHYPISSLFLFLGGGGMNILIPFLEKGRQWCMLALQAAQL